MIRDQQNLIASSEINIIVGLGVSGLSVARYLRRKNKPFVVMDSRQEPPGLSDFKKEFENIFLHLGSLDQSMLNQASEIILSPGLSLKTPQINEAIAKGVSVVGDVELFAREINQLPIKVPVAAITGSNAKTTVTTLIGEMAEDAGIKAAVGGNIGKPVLDLLAEGVELYILELSSFQLETTYTLQATVATVLNVCEDHMDRYENLAEYHRAKQRIYFGAKQVIVNRSDPLTQPPMAKGVKYYSFGLDEPDRNSFGLRQTKGQDMLSYEFEALMPASELKIRGQHNIANGLAALAIGHGLGISMQSMLSSLKKFTGLTHRCQFVKTIDDVDYINDSKGTNVGATLAAITGFSSKQKNIILIAGGDGKGANFSPLKKAVAESVILLILIGRDASLIAHAIEDVDIKIAETMKDAVYISKQKAQPGNIVLLSPACASFDMYESYQQRGQAFIDAVMEAAA